MAVTLTYVSNSQSSISVEAWHNISTGSRVYWDIYKNGYWAGDGYDILNSGGYRGHTFYNLNAGTSYSIRIRIINGAQSSLPQVGSASDSWSTQSAPVAPSTPSGFSASPVSQTGISLSWNGVSGASYYELWNDTLGRKENIYQTYWTWTGLSAGTSYSFSVRAMGNNGLNSSYAYASARTNSPPQPPATPSGLSLTVLSQTGIRISWNSSSRANYYSLYNTYTGSIMEPIYSTSYDWVNLSHSTRYGFQVRAVGDGGNSSYSSAQYATTNSPPVTNAPTGFSLSATSSSAITASWSGVSGATSYEVSFHTGRTGSSTTSSTSLGFTGLLPNTYYGAYVKAYSSAGGWSVASNSGYTTTHKARPSNFSWTNAKTSGGSFNLTAVEWNNLCSTINSFRGYKNQNNYSFTSATRGNSFTANQYNEARNAISSMNPSTSIPAYKSAGDIIYASDIDRLRSSLNSVT